MLNSLRLTWRMQRWELAVLIGGPLLFAAAAVFVAWQTTVTLEGIGACYTDSVALSASCRSLVQWSNVLTALTPILEGATVVAPFVVGMLLGAPLVSREIEKRTAPIAWSLSLSRARWLAGRTLPLLVAIAIALLLLGQASEALIRATPPGEIGFRHFAMHGPLVAGRAISVFGAGVVVGLLMGRVLPAILVTGLVVAALLAGLYVMRDQLMRAEATWGEAGIGDFSGVMIYDSAFTDDATGELVTSEEAYNRFPEVFGMEGSGVPPGMTQVYLMTPPERYPVFVAREIGALAIVSVLVGGLALWVITWRRPDLG
jgi:ABC-type transport system involved in multi-copper enzyme maturation permease subunit